MKFYRDLFEASLNRVVPEHDKQRFFQAFYSTFIHMSPETEQHFSQRSGEEGQQMIFKSFFAMLAVNGDLFVPDFLERLARAQSEEGLRLPPRFLPSGGKRCSKPSAPAIRCAMRRSSPHGQWPSPWARVSAPPGGAPLSNCWPVIMHAANRNDLNLLPSAVMIYDERERLQAWNDKVALFYPTIAPWLAVGASLESLAEKFIDAGYNIDPGRQQTLREAIIRNCRQTNHCEVRQSGNRRIYVQHQRLADGGWRDCQPAYRHHRA